MEGTLRTLWLVKNLRVLFSTFPLCSQMPVVFHHSVIHGMLSKTWAFDQSEHAQDPIYIMISYEL